MTDQTEPPTMFPARGAVILCDYLARMEKGKWLIVGTYTHWQTTESVLHMGLIAYLRFQVEESRPYTVRTLLIDRIRPSTEEPLIDISANVTTTDPAMPIEACLRLPPFVITRPRPGAVRLHYTLWVEVDRSPLATCPLIIDFLEDAVQ